MLITCATIKSKRQSSQKLKKQKINDLHCVKRVHIRSFLVRIFHIQTEYREIRSISPYSVRMQENTDQKISEYEYFSRSVNVPFPCESIMPAKENSFKKWSYFKILCILVPLCLKLLFHKAINQSKQISCCHKISNSTFNSRPYFIKQSTSTKIN